MVETRLYACRIERHVHAGAAAQLAHPRDYIVFGRIEHVVGAELFRECFPSRRDLGDYDLFGTFGHECLDHCEPDWPAAEDQDRVAFLEWAGFDGVPCYSQWFYECWIRGLDDPRAGIERLMVLPPTSIEMLSGIGNTAFRGITTCSESPPPHPEHVN